MKTKNDIIHMLFACLLGNVFCMSAQIAPGTYISDVDNVRHELKIDDDYFIHSEYQTSPAKFVKTVGGVYTFENDILKIDLEFNSNYEADELTELAIPIVVENDKLIFPMDGELEFIKKEALNQDLDGDWLFAMRGPDKGGERRDEQNPRKTLKFLQDGHFQWIAYNTDTMKFSGTGGGSFTSEGGQYVENIEYFSRDDSRVGATLSFNYQLKDSDWHHTGKNSKGEPMYEIWAPRE